MLAVADWIVAAGAIGSFVGGIGAAIGGVAAMKAARASLQAAKDARDAIALAVQPHLQLMVGDWDGRLVARAWVSASLPLPVVRPAADVVLQFVLGSGKAGSASTPLLEANPNAPYPLHHPYLEVEIATLGEAFPPPEGDRVEITCLFSDERKVANYKLYYAANLRRPASGALAIEPTVGPLTERVALGGSSDS
jgi:hypothetical protein